VARATERWLEALAIVGDHFSLWKAMIMHGLMENKPLKMTTRNVLPDAFLPTAVSDSLISKDHIKILGWLHPGTVVSSESSHDQNTENDKLSGNKLAGDMKFHVVDSPQEAYFKIKQFFSQEIPAEVTHDNKDLQRIEAVVFVGFVGLEIEVMVQSWQDATTITVRDRSRSDVVRMHHIYAQLKASLAKQTEQVVQDESFQDLQHQVLPQDSLDEFEDDWADSQAMRDRAEALLIDVTSRSVDMRVGGAQVLASWAQECPESRVHIAETLLRNDSHVVQALFHNSNLSLAEAYPLAAMLLCTFNCPDAASIMQNSAIARELFTMRRLGNRPIAALVARELSMAVICLDKVGP